MFRKSAIPCRNASDLTDAEWAVLAPLIPDPQPGGRPARHERRELVDAVFYVPRKGVARRALPHQLLPWQTVYHYFRRWRLDGTWEAITGALRERARVQAGWPAHRQRASSKAGAPRSRTGVRAATTPARKSSG